MLDSLPRLDRDNRLWMLVPEALERPPFTGEPFSTPGEAFPPKGLPLPFPPPIPRLRKPFKDVDIENYLFFLRLGSQSGIQGTTAGHVCWACCCCIGAAARGFCWLFEYCTRVRYSTVGTSRGCVRVLFFEFFCLCSG